MDTNPIERLKDLAISESGFLFDPYSGDTFTLNKTGKFIFQLLTEEKGIKENESALEKRFEVGEEDLRRCKRRGGDLAISGSSTEKTQEGIPGLETMAIFREGQGWVGGYLIQDGKRFEVMKKRDLLQDLEDKRRDKI